MVAVSHRSGAAGLIVLSLCLLAQFVTAEPLRFGGATAYPPFHYRVDGEPRGFDVEVFRAIAGRLDFEPQYMFGEWSSIQEALAAGELDVVPMFVSEERATRFLFSDPILVENHLLFALSDQPYHRTPESLAGLRIAAEGEAWVFQELARLGIAIVEVPASSEGDALMRVLQGEADYALVPARVAWHGIASQGLEGLSVHSPPLFPVTYALAIAPSRLELLPAINDSLDAMQRSGQMQDLQDSLLDMDPAPASLQPTLWALLGLAVMAVVALERWLRYRGRLRQAAAQLGGQRDLLRQVQKRSREASLVDALTGLPREQPFLHQAEERLGFHRSRTLAMAVLQAANFREIRLGVGQQLSDQLVQMAARVFAEMEGAFVGYLGQGSFAVLLAGVEDAAGAMAVLERYCEAASRERQVGDYRLSLVLRGGLAVFPDHGDSAQQLLRCAELALGQVQPGDSPLRLYSNAMEPDPRHLTLMDDLRRALDDDQLHWVYQPQVDTRTGALVAAEMLVRWFHPCHGTVPPDLFIPLAERSGQIAQLTDKVLQRGLADLRRWRGAGMQCGLAINVSANDLADGARVARILDEVGELGELLTLEITETAIMREVNAISANLEQLREARIRLSLDDYGTGYSSMDYLKRFNFDELKVDKSFVAAISKSPRDLELVKASIDLGHALGAGVVAEGVEDAVTARILAGLGCDILQGYGVSRPLPHDEFVRFCRSTPQPIQNGPVPVDSPHLA